MSRIFEALQRSESERSGTPLAPPALATELLQVVEREAIGHAPPDSPVSEFDAPNSSKNNSLTTICAGSNLCQSHCRPTAN